MELSKALERHTHPIPEPLVPGFTWRPTWWLTTPSRAARKPQQTNHRSLLSKALRTIPCLLEGLEQWTLHPDKQPAVKVSVKQSKDDGVSAVPVLAGSEWDCSRPSLPVQKPTANTLTHRKSNAKAHATTELHQPLRPWSHHPGYYSAGMSVWSYRGLWSCAGCPV